MVKFVPCSHALLHARLIAWPILFTFYSLVRKCEVSPAAAPLASTSTHSSCNFALVPLHLSCGKKAMYNPLIHESEVMSAYLLLLCW